jgi:hypothetical protein
LADIRTWQGILKTGGALARGSDPALLQIYDDEQTEKE